MSRNRLWLHGEAPEAMFVEDVYSSIKQPENECRHRTRKLEEQYLQCNKLVELSLAQKKRSVAIQG